MRKQRLLGFAFVPVAYGLMSSGQEAAAAIAYVKSTPEGRTTGAASKAVSFATLPSTGNAILVYAMAWNNATVTWPTTGCTDNQGNTYTRAVAVSGNHISSSYLAIALYYSTGIAAPSGTFTVTVTPSTSVEMTVMAVEYSGIATSNALDQKATDNGTTGPADTGTTLTTTQANELAAAIIAIGCSSGTCTSLPTPTGFTSRLMEADSTYTDGQFVDRIVSSTGTYSASWNFNSSSWSNDWFGLIAMFKAAASTSKVKHRVIRD